MRLRLAYGAVAAAILLAAALVPIALEGSSHRGDPHIDLATGSTNGVAPDERPGTVPPPLHVADLSRAAALAKCDLRRYLRDEGHRHVPPSAPTPAYRTDPPTSGTHVEPPYQQADGAYRETPQALDYVHSLEHGRLEIQYSPGLPRSDQRQLIGLYDTMWGGTLLFPNRRMPYEVAATTWTNLLGCGRYRGSITLDAIRDFGRATWNRYGGRPSNDFDPTAPTPDATEPP